MSVEFACLCIDQQTTTLKSRVARRAARGDDRNDNGGRNFEIREHQDHIANKRYASGFRYALVRKPIFLSWSTISVTGPMNWEIVGLMAFYHPVHEEPGGQRRMTSEAPGFLEYYEGDDDDGLEFSAFSTTRKSRKRFRCCGARFLLSVKGHGPMSVSLQFDERCRVAF